MLPDDGALTADDADGAPAPVHPERDDQLRIAALSMAVQSARNDDSPERVARRAHAYYLFLKGEQPA